MFIVYSLLEVYVMYSRGVCLSSVCFACAVGVRAMAWFLLFVATVSVFYIWCLLLLACVGWLRRVAPVFSL